MKQKVFLFDFDGVIVDSFEDCCNRLLPVFKKYGKNLSDEDIRELFIGNAVDNTAKHIPKDKLHDFVQETYAHFDLEKLLFFPKITELLNDLEKIGKLIIITSNRTDVVKSVLVHHNVLPHLEILGWDIEHSKTKKIHMIKEKFPEADFVYVGDTVGDIYEAKAAGISSIAVSYGYHKREWLEEAKPDHIADSVDQLRKILLG